MPGLLWIHGGGYAMGIPEQDHGFVRSFVGATGCVMVVPDYKKSLYAPFPAALEDCYLALLWLKENGKKYGMRRDKIFVGGNSAGGGMTAALTLYARDRGEVNIAFQMPLYPMLDDRPTETSKNNDAPVWNTKSNIAAWELYLGSDYGTDRVSKYAAPARETDFSGLPPTLTFIGSIDPFLAETKSYVERCARRVFPLSSGYSRADSTASIYIILQTSPRRRTNSSVTASNMRRRTTARRSLRIYKK